MSNQEPSNFIRRIGCVACILIAGGAFSFLTMAVMTARETARRMNCSGNMKQLGLGFHNYHSAYKNLPANCGGTGPTPGNDALSNQRRLSAMVAISPFLEASSLWENISNPYPTGVVAVPRRDDVKCDFLRESFNGLAGADGPLVDEDGKPYFPAMGPAPWLAPDYPPWQFGYLTFRCPSDGNESTRGRASFSNYAFCFGNTAKGAGIPFDGFAPNDPSPDGQASGTESPDRAHSVTKRNRGLFMAGKAVRFRDITDGLASTVMSAEMLTFDQSRDVRRSVAANVPSVLTDPRACLRLSTTTGHYRSERKLRLTPDGLSSRGNNWADGMIAWSGFNTVLPPNSPSCDVSAARFDEGAFSAASVHPGGCHALFADGRVVFITDSVDTNATAGHDGVWDAAGSYAGSDASELRND